MRPPQEILASIAAHGATIEQALAKLRRQSTAGDVG